MNSALRQENGGGSQRSASFKAMLPSQGQTSTARKASANGLRESNSTSFRFFSNQDDVQARQKPSTTNRSELAACLDETSRMLKDMSSKSASRSQAASKTVTGMAKQQRGGTFINKRLQQKPPAPKAYFAHNQKESNAVDGYFSSKLSKSIENLTKSTDMLKLSKSANAPSKTNGLIFKCKCRRFKVGKAESRYPSDVRFFEDRVEYQFVRESQFGKDHIAMVMFYRDMISAKLSTQQGCFVYRIPRNLHHYFQDYEPENQLHVMKVKFERNSEMKEFKESVLHVIQGQSQEDW